MKKKLIVYIRPEVYQAVRSHAFETEQFKSTLVERVLAKHLGVDLDKINKKKAEVTDDR